MPSKRMGAAFFILVSLSTHVYGEGKKENLALNKPTEQSSLFYEGVGGKAVDGDRSYLYDYCAHTESTPLNWWLVDLQAFYYITDINITTRETSWERLTNFTVEISIQPPSALSGFPGNTKESSLCVRVTTPIPSMQTSSYKCEEPLMGRYIRVVKYNTIAPDNAHLSLCEFEAYGFKQWKFDLVTSGSGSGSAEILETVPGKMQLLECATKCRQKQKTPVCRYIRYDMSSGLCQLLDNNGYFENNSNWAVYKKVVPE